MGNAFVALRRARAAQIALIERLGGALKGGAAGEPSAGGGASVQAAQDALDSFNRAITTARATLRCDGGVRVRVLGALADVVSVAETLTLKWEKGYNGGAVGGQAGGAFSVPSPAAIKDACVAVTATATELLDTVALREAALIAFDAEAGEREAGRERAAAAASPSSRSLASSTPGTLSTQPSGRPSAELGNAARSTLNALLSSAAQLTTAWGELAPVAEALEMSLATPWSSAGARDLRAAVRAADAALLTLTGFTRGLPATVALTNINTALRAALPLLTELLEPQMKSVDGVGRLCALLGDSVSPRDLTVRGVLCVNPLAKEAALRTLARDVAGEVRFRLPRVRTFNAN